MKIQMCFLLLVTILLSSCKKDHPNDIPKWLKLSIKEFKRTGKSHGEYECELCPMEIHEWKDATSHTIMYSFKSCSPTFYTFYDRSGERICSVQPYCTTATCECGTYNYADFVKVRLVWKADCLH